MPFTFSKTEKPRTFVGATIASLVVCRMATDTGAASASSQGGPAEGPSGLPREVDDAMMAELEVKREELEEAMAKPNKEEVPARLVALEWQWSNRESGGMS